MKFKKDEIDDKILYHWFNYVVTKMCPQYIPELRMRLRNMAADEKTSWDDLYVVGMTGAWGWWKGLGDEDKKVAYSSSQSIDYINHKTNPILSSLWDAVGNAMKSYCASEKEANAPFTKFNREIDG